jgi:hypothetical protein
MAIYVTYETFTAQASNPKAECNKNYFSAGVMSTEIVVGFVMNIIALLYLTFATKENSSKMLKVQINSILDWKRWGYDFRIPRIKPIENAR